MTALSKAQLIQVLQSTGKPVHVYPGDFYDGGDFAPMGVCNHQTAGPPIATARMPDYIKNVLLKPSKARPGQFYPLCQISIDGAGHIWVVSARRAAHAMLIGPAGVDAVQHGKYPVRPGLYTGFRSGATKNGNQWSYGIEITNNDGAAIRNGVQWDAVVAVNAALILALGQTAGSVFGHGEQGTDRDPKLDPGFDVGELRVEVSRRLAPVAGGGAGGGAPDQGEDDDMTPAQAERLEAIYQAVAKIEARTPTNLPQAVGRIDVRTGASDSARIGWTYDAVRTVVIPLLQALGADSNVDTAKLDAIIAKLDELGEPQEATE